MKKKILLIEDDRIMRENTAELLELSGYDVGVAENGKVGLELVKDFQPELIVCDVMMPELDGYGVLYILSKEPETAAIPFIFLTAKTEKEDLRKGMNLGADDYLTKPFEDMELLDAVESRLKKFEIVKKEFSNDLEGLNDFLDEAQNMINIETLTANRKAYTYKPKEFLYRHGDYANYLFFVNKGKIKTYKINEDAKEYITDIYNPGDFLGYQPLLEEREYSEYASPITTAEIFKIPKADFLTLIHKNRDVATKFIRMISRNLSEKEEQLVQLAYDSVKRRIALKLQSLFNDNAEKVATISRTDLAGMIGTSKETVVRTLTNFKEDGIIETNGQQIELIDAEKLKKILQWI